MRVLKRVADNEDEQPENLDPPLFEAIDAHGLDSFVRSLGENQPDGPGKAVFEYYEYLITMSADGSIQVEELAD